jgi:hypothetical protein
MPVLTRGHCVQWIEVAGRKIKLKSLGGVQSVNICTSANRAGDYEETKYLEGSYKMTPDEVARYGNLNSLKAELRRRDYRQHK